MGFLKMIRAVRARRAIAVSVALLWVALAMSAFLMHEKSYCATASLVLQYKGGDLHHDWYLSKQTQVELMRNQQVALNVVDALALTASPSFQHAYNDAANSSDNMRSWIATHLLQGLEVQPARNNDIVNISFSAADPDFAAQVANAFAYAYLQASATLQRKQFPDAAILNLAAVPVEPAGLKLWQVASLSLLSGAIAGAMLAVLLEMQDRHIRSSQDLADAIDVPVLGALKLGQPQAVFAAVSGTAGLWRLFRQASWRP